MSDLGVLFPQPEHVLVGRLRVELRPVRLKDFETYGVVAGQVVSLLGTDLDALNAFAARNARALQRAVVCCTSLNRWQVWRMPLAVLLQVFCLAIRANTGFFAQALPALAEALGGRASPSS